ncbi:uncharacterized protein Tco025E_01461 [Trypanosoma conorhini]|uniref:CSD domain-containing protein n=1 Tax=Trypanosoma conorhini TaxID=83891 RepID=A0A422Q8D4_9TRYP|nr:uncharacterized protein Tco025E_01461 [Trypanosoma conorhini]RNF26245.1 hypothetical protein Tco025E_01461 [Trypanosoma conorhini]
MFLQPGSWATTCDLGGPQFIAFGLSNQRLVPAPMGYPPAEAQQQQQQQHVYPPTPPSFAQSCNGAGHRGEQGGGRGSWRQSGSNLGSCETSPGQVSGSGWGLSMQSPTSSPASSMGTPPVYFVLQPSPAQSPQLAAPSANIMALPPHAPPAAPHGPSQENGTRYELGEWYEGVVKRYNPMRGFGFLTATHHLKVISPPPLPAQQQTSITARTNTPPSPTAAIAAAAGATQPKKLDARNDAHMELQAHVVRTPVTIGDIFLHQSYIQMQGFRALSIGDKVVFRVGVLQGKKAHQAVSVQRVPNTENREAVTAPAPRVDAAPLTATEEKSATQQPAEPSAHTRKSLEQLLQHVAMKQEEGLEGEPGDELTMSAFSLDPEAAREECGEGCSLPTPMFCRNFPSIGCTNAVDEQESAPYTSEPIAFAENDEVWEFLANFGVS